MTATDDVQDAEVQDAELKDAEPQGAEPPAATSLDPRLTRARPYVDMTTGGTRSDPVPMPRFTPRQDLEPSAGPAADAADPPLPTRSPRRRKALPAGRPTAPADGQPEARTDGGPDAPQDGRAPGYPAGRAPVPAPPAAASRPRVQPVRAIIGDEIGIPTMWCDFQPCDATYTHPDALGERDLRARALAAGWRYDALGRRACPKCAQHDPTFWTARAAGKGQPSRSRGSTWVA